MPGCRSRRPGSPWPAGCRSPCQRVGREAFRPPSAGTGIWRRPAEGRRSVLRHRSRRGALLSSSPDRARSVCVCRDPLPAAGSLWRAPPEEAWAFRKSPLPEPDIGWSRWSYPPAEAARPWSAPPVCRCLCTSRISLSCPPRCPGGRLCPAGRP